MTRSRLLAQLLVIVAFLSFALPASAASFRFQGMGALGVGLTDVNEDSFSGFGGGFRLTLGVDITQTLGLGGYFLHTRSAVDSFEDSGLSIDRSVRESGIGLYGAFNASPVRFDVFAGYAFGSVAYSPDTEGGFGNASVNVGLDGFQFGAFVAYNQQFTSTISMQFGPWVQLGLLSTEGEISSEIVGLETDESLTHIMILFAAQLSVGGAPASSR